MAISFRFRIIIKRQPEILIKSEQTLPENNNVLEILQQENCTTPFHYLIPKLQTKCVHYLNHIS